MKINDILVEFAPSGDGGGSGDYFQALASAWYNGTFDTGSLQKGIKSQQDVEQLLNRGIIGPDGVTRKYGIDYNSTFDGVVISSDDYYEHADHDETDSRTGKPFGPYDYMEFGDEELDESAKYRDPKYKDQLYTQEPPDYNDTREYDNARFNPKPKGYPGRKKLPGGGEYDRTDPLVRGAGIGRSGIKNNINLSGKRKGLPSRDQITSLKQSIKDISGGHTRANLPEQDMAEAAFMHSGQSAPSSGIGGTAKYGYGLNDIRNARGKNPEIDVNLRKFKAWINGGPKPVDINDVVQSVEVYFTNVKPPSDARVSTAFDQILNSQVQGWVANKNQAMLLNPSLDAAIAEPLPNQRAGNNQNADGYPIAPSRPMAGQAVQAVQAAQATQQQTTTAPVNSVAPAGKKFNTAGATTVTPRPVTRPALPNPRLREQGVAEGAPISGDGGAVDNFRQQMANNAELAYQKGMAEGNRKPEPPEADYGDDYQDMVKRVKRLAGVGPLKTQYDPARRVYRNMPTAVQPKK